MSQVGSCELRRVPYEEVTRETLMTATEPLVITGLTTGWSAMRNWKRDEFLRLYGDEPYQLHSHGNDTVGKLLEWQGKYHMGHAVYPPEGCYSDPWRPYSPMLFGALGDDYSLPAYLNPMSTFQMGMGSGPGIGVPPENHPSSWFAAISGRKRWVLNPPSAGTGRSGGYGTEPPEVMGRSGKSLCVPKFKQKGSLMCDQREGDIFWVPDFWWHETCGLDPFSIGIGGITYSGCCEDQRRFGSTDCTTSQHEKGRSYAIKDIATCSADLPCGTLPNYAEGTLQPTWMSAA